MLEQLLSCLIFFNKWGAALLSQFSFLKEVIQILALSQLWICSPPPSVLIRFLWMMGSVLYSMEKTVYKLSDFYFSSYREKCIEN